MIGKWALVCVGGPIMLTFFIVIAINIVQRKRPILLPLWLQNWEFLPLWMHSLDPIDELIAKLVERCSCLSCCAGSQSRHDASALGQQTNQSQLHILGSLNNSSSTQLKHIYENDGYILHWESIELNKQLQQKEATNL